MSDSNPKELEDGYEIPTKYCSKFILLNQEESWGLVYQTESYDLEFKPQGVAVASWTRRPSREEIATAITVTLNVVELAYLAISSRTSLETHLLPSLKDLTDFTAEMPSEYFSPTESNILPGIQKENLQ